MKVIQQVELDHSEVAQITVKVPYFPVQYRTQAMLMEYVRCCYSRSVSCAVCYPGLPSLLSLVFLRLWVALLPIFDSRWFCQSTQNQFLGNMAASICDGALPYLSCYQLWIAVDHLCFVNSVNKLLVVMVIKYVSELFNWVACQFAYYLLFFSIAFVWYILYFIFV